MLANLIATIMMALGVATGNVSSNVYKSGNAFYDEIEIDRTKPIQQQTTNIVNNESYTKKQNLIKTQENTNDEKWEKWYLGNNTNYSNAFVNIRNTIYTDSWVSNKYLRVNTWHIYEITPYYTSNTNNIVIDIDISIKLKLSGSIGQNVSGMYSYIGVANNTTYLQQNLQNYIDLTLTDSINDTIDTLSNNTTWEYTPTTTENQIGNDYEYTTSKRFTTSVPLRMGESQYLLFYTNLSNQGNYDFYQWLQYDWNLGYNDAWEDFIKVTPSQMTIQAEDIVVPNYEIVDIPNVMYTILTMPFSFISTAFNLTVFPNTPYALNFGNLFLTIVAVFILLWLIKKVFH